MPDACKKQDARSACDSLAGIHDSSYWTQVQEVSRDMQEACATSSGG
jgi:hypothetical protein